MILSEATLCVLQFELEEEREKRSVAERMEKVGTVAEYICNKLGKEPAYIYLHPGGFRHVSSAGYVSGYACVKVEDQSEHLCGQQTPVYRRKDET